MKTHGEHSAAAEQSRNQDRHTGDRTELQDHAAPGAGRASARTLQRYQLLADESPRAKHLQQFQHSADNASPVAVGAPQARATAGSNTTGLPEPLKAGIETLSNMSMDHVRVHYHSPKPAQLHAHAYAQGNEIHLAPGQERHLPHEAWHIVQQAQGRVRPTTRMLKTTAINDEAGLEREADLMGALALHVAAEPHSLPGHAFSTGAGTRADMQTWPSAVASVAGVVQRRVLSKIVVARNEQDPNLLWIVEVIIGGRTPSPFSGTMGAHSTAWIAHVDAVRRLLVNTQLPGEGANALAALAREELEASPLLALEHMLEPAHKAKLDKAGESLKEQCTIIEALGQTPDARPEIVIGALRQLIERYLTFVNYLPLATVDGGDPAGHGEGSARAAISAFEYVKTRELGIRGDDQQGWTDLGVEVGSLGSSTLATLTKEHYRAARKGEQIEQDALKKNLVETLWTMFAAETPDVFLSSRTCSDDDKANTWKAAIHSFLNTIRRAYPQAYDFTQMHTKEPQEQGFEFAMNLAKIQLAAELKPAFPVTAIDAEFRNSHDEVTLLDLKQAGSGFLATILLSESAESGDTIGDVEITGRTKSPFSRTMGAHTTAWAAHLDAVRNVIIGKNVFDGLQTLKKKSEEAMHEEGVRLSHLVDEKQQQYLAQAFENLVRANDAVIGMKDQSLQTQIAQLEYHIALYLTFTNFLPLSTLEGGGIPGGRSEGMHRTFLLNYEKAGPAVFDKLSPPPSSEERQAALRQHVEGMYDRSGLKMFPPLLGQREASNPLDSMPAPTDATKAFVKHFKKPAVRPKAAEVAYKRFLRTMLEAYPRAMHDSGLLEGDENSPQGAVRVSIEKVYQEEVPQLTELLQQNNCLINAVCLAALQRTVTAEELLKIRQRLGEIGTMLIASERTLSIICDVLNIRRGIVVTYVDRPSEDFGDTAADPVMIRHTGHAHFEPWRRDVPVSSTAIAEENEAGGVVAAEIREATGSTSNTGSSQDEAAPQNLLLAATEEERQMDVEEESKKRKAEEEKSAEDDSSEEEVEQMDVTDSGTSQQPAATGKKKSHLKKKAKTLTEK